MDNFFVYIYFYDIYNKNKKMKNNLNEELLEESVLSWIDEKIQQIKQKIKDLKKAGKREGYETALASKIILNLIKNREATPEEIDFLKSQSVDMAKIIGLLGIASIPGGNTTVAIIEKLLRKYDVPFSLLPTSHKKPENVDFVKKQYPDKELFEMFVAEINKEIIDKIIKEEIEKQMKLLRGYTL